MPVSMHRLLIPALLAGALVAFGACTDDDPDDAAPAATTDAREGTPTSMPTGTATDAADNGDGPRTLIEAVTDVVENARPSVVQITVEQQLPGGGGDTVVPAGVGSGVIIDDDGHILTNDHVITGAQGLVVHLADGREVRAEIVGQDPQTDLAVIRIEPSDLQVASIGSSEALEVGEWVVAIGNALGLVGGPTVTTGVVSAVGRTVQEPPGQDGGPGPFLFDVIQTDAAINPGNSGGPLLNLDGEVVGINTLVAGGGEVPTQGIGFAIAIDTAMPLAEELIATGDVEHPYLGVYFIPLNAAVAAQLGTPVRQGVLVRDVEPGSPAAEAGLQPNDIIVAADGEPLEGESDLPEVLNDQSVGDEITLEVRRGDGTEEISVTLGEAPQE